MTYPKFKNKHQNKSLLSPEEFIKYKKFEKNLPKKCIIIYSNKAMDYLKEKYDLKPIITLSHLDSYVYKDILIVRVFGVGSPLAAIILEELSAMGVKIFLNIGLAGGLIKEGIFICNKAIRDEGTSYHYLKSSNYSYPDKELSKKFENTLTKNKIIYEKGITWTIDAPYRETTNEIEHYRKKGVVTVEMESSALFSVAKVKKLKVASAFVVSDILGKKWDPKFDHIDVKTSLRNLLDCAIECLTNQ